MFAHSLDGQPISKWERLSDHLAAVAGRAANFAAVFGWPEAARAAGQLHDIGKCSVAFQAYISAQRDGATGGRRGPDHSTAGARAAVAIYPHPAGRLLAFGIAGHHAGLADGKELDRRLDDEYAIQPHDGWQAHSGEQPAAALLVPPTDFDFRHNKAFTAAFLTRMLFSCLVDADFLETEAFYARAKGEVVERGDFAGIVPLRDRLRSYMVDKRARAPASSINALRDRVLDHAVGKAALCSGLFTLTVPTGGGKTLASLSFALEHAVFHGMDRVIYVIPYTSIIEQTAQVFREALDTKDDVLEHHASFDWEAAGAMKDPVIGADDEGPGGVDKLRRAAENWDAPIVVTTAVQFFESLFANRASRCRKLHNLANAVIVLDEAQSLPIHLLRPCMAALDELCRNYGVSVVLCTATQPALRAKDGFEGGFKIDEDRELAPEPQALYTALKRVTVETLPEPVADTVIASRFSEQPRMLCIVNSRAHARGLFETIRDLPGATHLTTLMCPRHRRAVLQTVRTRLDPKNPQPIRLVATSLIEAGVDVDFPEVWRAAAGLDSIAQAAGRCNREGRLAMGRTVVFVPADNKPPRAVEAYWQATRSVLRKHDDLLGFESIKAYFGELYWQKGAEALDAVKVDGRLGILAAIAERVRDFSFPFRSIADAFRLIDEIMEPVIVPWQSDPSDDDAKRLLAQIAAMDRPRAVDLRRLQQYTVSIPRKARDTWLAAGAVRPVHPSLGAGLLCFEDLAHYRPDTGIDVGDTWLRSAESNMIA
ncbi:MAG: CRISPR-associated endonuclease Cas3'' [Rhodopila sp.]|nr:CRISPR-associated endonuclease Cas3'' [Rhodopila sp.]